MPPKSSLKQFTADEVGRHRSRADLYIVVDDKVYDVTGFIEEHPGGQEVLLDQGGLDATEPFEEVGHSNDARAILAGLQVGTLKRRPGDEKTLHTKSIAYKSYDSEVPQKGPFTLLRTLVALLIAVIALLELVRFIQ